MHCAAQCRKEFRNCGCGEPISARGHAASHLKLYHPQHCCIRREISRSQDDYRAIGNFSRNCKQKQSRVHTFIRSGPRRSKSICANRPTEDCRRLRRGKRHQALRTPVSAFTSRTSCFSSASSWRASPRRFMYLNAASEPR